MKAEQLRIGNLVNEGVVTELRQNSARVKYNLKGEVAQSLVFYDYLEPIPITEEWLVKFGFELNDRAILGVSYKIKGAALEVIKFDVDDYYTVYFKDVEMVKIRYVHQLQNLIFSVLGQEL